MYEVAAGDELLQFETRQEAIAEAKRISTDRRAPVTVTDARGREQLTFQRGELENYLLELR